MMTSTQQPLNRGASILSALVLVALLSGVAVGVQYLSPYTSSESQTATGAKAAPAKPGKAPKDEKKKECKPGEVNAVSIENGKVTKLDVAPIKCWDTAVKPPKRVATDNLCKDFDNPNDCRVAACATKDGKQVCQIVGKFDSNDPTAKGAFDKMMSATDPKELLKAVKENGNLPGLASLAGNMDSATRKALSDAFSEPIKETEEKIRQNEDAMSRIRGYIEACKGETRGTGCEADVLAAKKKDADDLAAKNDELKKQTDKLREAQVALRPPQCPAGMTGTPPRCEQTNTGCTGANCGPHNSATGFDTNKLGALAPLLQGLAKGLGGAGAPPPAPAQACQTDQNAYQQQQQQYQQSLQQYNYQLQVYNQQQQQASIYGTPAPIAPAQPTPCTPSTGNQCQSQPRQPDAGACTTGTWRATYTGACVTGWQCISTAGPKAELSCEPQTADVGMTLAVTYGCSSGVASSSSFRVTTQPGGSATTTVANPPAGTNTATYTLACTDNGKTTGAQCSIQVSRPNIILVANPKTVPANGTSLLSWLTTGMKSCVISSPDQADFTARNSSNTSVTGAATTSPIATSARFLLRCETVSGGVKEATTTVQVQ